MKKIILLLSVLLPQCTLAQISFNFEDGSVSGWTFSAPGRWAADNTNSLNGLYSLHHVYDNSEASNDAAVFSIEDLCLACSQTEWMFTVRHGADPSASNKWSFIVISDSGIEGFSSLPVLNGYAVGVNLTGYDDTLRLWHMSQGKATAVITTGVNWQEDVGVDKAVMIRVTRQPDGYWVLEAALAGGVELGTWGKANGEYDPLRCRYAGISYSYTSTRDRLLWLDDVSVNGTFVPDTLSPTVVSVSALTPDILQVIFDEEPDVSCLSDDNISIGEGLKVRSVLKRKSEVYEIYLDENINNRSEYTMTFTRLCDQSGNCTSSPFYKFIPAYGSTGDVVITEIMADPAPPLQLPDDEYLELTNLSADSLSLMNWILIADKDTTLFPQIWIKSGEIVILCSVNDTMKYSYYGTTIGLASFPSLSDNGETLALRDGCGSLIHAVSYSKTFYHDNNRSGGGWSLEMTDTNNPFNAPEAWRASIDPSGGTPGRINSIEIAAPDNSCPQIIAAFPVAANMVRIIFEESIAGVFDKEGWITDGSSSVNVRSDDIADRAFIITTSENFKNGRILSLHIPPAASDFAGNAPCSSVVSFGIPETPLQGDIMFNELLFNPAPPCVDYIELYNNSHKIIDLSQLFFSSSAADEGGSPAVMLGTVPRQLMPGKYVALTTDKDVIANCYRCSAESEIHEIASMPSMPDDRGVIVLLDRKLNIIDQVEYTSSMHMIFLSGMEGIALEKVSPDLASGISSNWHSASESCDWGTPGAPNSVLLSVTDEQNGMTLSSERISPDGDGFEDVLSVNIIADGIDNVLTVSIVNDRGYMVRRLAERFFAGKEARFVWDGTDSSGSRLPAGLYMIMTEAYNSSGQIWRWKKVCALLYR